VEDELDRGPWWAAIDPTVEPVGCSNDREGRTVASVHQVVRDLHGRVVSDDMVAHVYRIEDGFDPEHGDSYGVATGTALRKIAMQREIDCDVFPLPAVMAYEGHDATSTGPGDSPDGR
jgi:hypothetical protein